MKLLDCYIENYGKFSQKSFSFTEGLTCFLMPNGEGKTTLASFLKAMLYGLDGYRETSLDFCDRKRYYPFSGGVFGGSLRIEWNGKRYKIERSFDGKSEKKDALRVYDEWGRPTDELGETPGEKLFSLSRAAFERTAFIDASTVEFSFDGGVGERLGDMVADVSEKDFSRAIESLREDRKQLQSDRKVYGKLTGRIPELSERIFFLEEELYRLQKVEAEYFEKRRELKEVVEREALAEQELLAFGGADNAAYRRLLSAAQAEEERFQSERARYPYGLPTEEELARVDALSAEVKSGAQRKEKRSGWAVWLCLALIFALVGALLRSLQKTAAIVCFVCAALSVTVALIMKGLKRFNVGQVSVEADEARREREREKILSAYGLTGWGTLEIREERARLSALESSAKALSLQAERYRAECGVANEEMEKNRARWKALTERRAALQETLSRAETELAQTGEKRERLRALQEEKEELVKRRRLLTAAENALLAADKRLKDGYLLPTANSFLRFAKALDGESFEKAFLSGDLKICFESGGIVRGIGHFSDGQKTLAWFAMRLALMENMYRTELPFLVLDDPFVSLDESSFGKVADALRRLAKDRQILYFCCHGARKL